MRRDAEVRQWFYKQRRGLKDLLCEMNHEQLGAIAEIANLPTQILIRVVREECMIRKQAERN